MPSPQSWRRELQGRPDPKRTLELLEQLAGLSRRPRDLAALHDALLFYKAYPRSRAVHDFCTDELARFAERIQGLDADERVELDQTGIVNTRLAYPYDDEMTRWLAARLGKHLEVDWDAYEEKDSDPLSGILPLLMEKAEGDPLDSPETSARDIVNAARGRKTSLQWLLERFDRGFAGPVRRQIYNDMQIPLTMTLVPGGPSRTLIDDGAPESLFLWNPEHVRRPFDLLTEIRRPLRMPPPVAKDRGRELLDLALSTLLPRLRELFPATYGNSGEVYDIPVGRGVRIVWWFMVPEYRLPLEAGWGCLILKNRMPIGYGAGGIFAERSEIAINVFDTFRGGEAAWLYAQYARICRAFCPAPWLVTRRWQLGGEGNEEGLVSGSFWFYDKLGFRSVDPAIRELADHERDRIRRQKGYRSPRRVLKRLVEADVVLPLDGQPVESYQEYPLSDVGLLATRVIDQQFGGDREGLEGRILAEIKRRYRVSWTRWTVAEKARFAQMGLFLLALPDLDKWGNRRRAQLFELARLKGSTLEADYCRAMSRNRRFFDELAALSAEAKGSSSY